jgi:hypothetical protein
MAFSFTTSELRRTLKPHGFPFGNGRFNLTFRLCESAIALNRESQFGIPKQVEQAYWLPDVPPDDKRAGKVFFDDDGRLLAR